MIDPYGPDVALRASGLLQQFNRAGVLNSADVHVARTLGRLTGETDESVLLAVALTVRNTRTGSVVLDLRTAPDTVAMEFDEHRSDEEKPAPPWPEPEVWIANCRAGTLIDTGEADARRPVQMRGERLWLDRYFRQEQAVARDLLARLADDPPPVDEHLLCLGVARLFPAVEDTDQRAAAELAVRSRLAVIIGGPGTGKTTTVARLLALLADQPGASRIALAAPTGKAAARLTETVHVALLGLDPTDATRVGTPQATTVHRLLGFRPGSRNRFRHDRENRLPHDVVVIDETSMVSLTLMARLLEALRPSARLVLVGDPDQLASVEAGAVLGDLTAADGESAGGGPATDPGLARVVARLDRARRFAAHSAIADLAAAIRRGSPQDAREVLARGGTDVEFIEIDDEELIAPRLLESLRLDVCRTGAMVLEAARAGDAEGALAAADTHRLLCAHRSGPFGVSRWSEQVVAWLDAAGVRPVRGSGHGGARAIGEPLLVTANDPDLGLFNGDTGVVVADAGKPEDMVAAFHRAGGIRLVPLGRLSQVRPVHAMTVHRSQGSEFRTVSVLLPPASSPLATRQTLYTAVTRATGSVRIIGSRAGLERAITHQAARASGLAERLSGRTRP